MAPNLLIILTDQQRYDAMSCHGERARTPHLDALAASGCDLRGHLANSPVCVPSRCTIFTGRYPHSHGVRENDARLHSQEPHLFKYLKAAGYRIGYVGKNHLLDAEDTANADYWDEGLLDPSDPDHDRFKRLHDDARRRMVTIGPWSSAQFHDLPEEKTSTGLTALRAQGFLRGIAPSSPFCLTVSFNDPHAPHLAPRRFDRPESVERLRPLAKRREEVRDKAPRIAVKKAIQRVENATEEDRLLYLRAYGAMIEFVDEKVGEILATLEELGVRENTLVVFTSDHGDFGFDYGMCKKDLALYDCLLHVPCVFSMPGTIPAGTATSSLTGHVDLVPTLLDYAGIRIPHFVQGLSRRALIEGRGEPGEDVHVSEICYPYFRNPFRSAQEFQDAFLSPGDTWLEPPRGKGVNYNLPGDFVKAIRTARWKLILFGDGFVELYDIEADTGETHNLASDPAHAATLEELKRRLLQWCFDSEDPLSPLDRKRFHASIASRWPNATLAVAP